LKVENSEAPAAPPEGPLAGLRVLDLSRMVAGALVGVLLADFGADVVKVEQPGTGDPLRTWTTGGEPFWWKVYARNKRLITLNLKVPRGREILALAARQVVEDLRRPPFGDEAIGEVGSDEAGAAGDESSTFHSLREESSGFAAGAAPAPPARSRPNR